jgi:hypothetical protein
MSECTQRLEISQFALYLARRIDREKLEPGREYIIYLRPRKRTRGGKRGRPFDVEVRQVVEVGVD